MKLSPYSFNGVQINDGTNYTSKILLQPAMPNARLSFVSRGINQGGNYTGKSVSDWYMKILVTMLGTVSSQTESLKALFDTRIYSAKTLVALDTSEGAGNRSWSISAATASMGEVQGRSVIITLGFDDVWKTTATTTESTWTITASGQTNVVNCNLGNLDAYPIYEITPGTAKTGEFNFVYRHFVTTYNQKTWAFPNYPVDLTNGGWDTASVIADNSNKCQINVGGGINASVTTIPYDTVTGTIPSQGMVYAGTEQISYTGRTGTTSGNLTGCTRGVGGTTAASHADNTVMYLSHMLINGADVRVFVGKGSSAPIEVDRWFGTGSNAINQAATKVWVNLDYSAKQEFTLKTSLGSGAITEILVNEDISSMPDEGALMLESEIITYTSKSDAGRRFRGTLTRGAYETSAATHAVGVTVRWIENVIYIYHGDASATVPTVDDTKKPIIKLTSTNTSHIYEEFFSTDPRSAEWRAAPSPVQTPTYTYTGNNITYIDPSTELGVSGGRISATGAEVASYWILTNPAGITNWNFSNGEKRNLVLGVGLVQYNTQTSPNTPQANLWTTGYTIPATTLANTWQSWSDSRALGATYYHIRLAVTTRSSVTRVEAADCTVTLDSGGAPSVTFGSEVANNHNIRATLSNDTTGESMYINSVIIEGQTLQIDTLTKRVRYLYNNQNRLGDVQLIDDNNTSGGQWLRLQQGNNTLSWTETGVTSTAVVIKWRGRNN